MKIVFLNSCYSGAVSGFAGAFGATAFLGWKGKVDYVDSDDIAFQWWRNMVSLDKNSNERTAYSAAYALGKGEGEYLFFDSTNPDKPLLVVEGNDTL